MAGSRTYTRGFQPIPTVTEKCYPVSFFAALVPRSSRPMPTVSDPSVTKCDTLYASCESSLELLRPNDGPQ